MRDPDGNIILGRIENTESLPLTAVTALTDFRPRTMLFKVPDSVVLWKWSCPCCLHECRWHLVTGDTPAPDNQYVVRATLRELFAVFRYARALSRAALTSLQGNGVGLRVHPAKPAGVLRCKGRSGETPEGLYVWPYMAC